MVPDDPRVQPIQKPGHRILAGTEDSQRFPQAPAQRRIVLSSCRTSASAFPGEDAGLHSHAEQRNPNSRNRAMRAIWARRSSALRCCLRLNPRNARPRVIQLYPSIFRSRNPRAPTQAAVDRAGFSVMTNCLVPTAASRNTSGKYRHVVCSGTTAAARLTHSAPGPEPTRRHDSAAFSSSIRSLQIRGDLRTDSSTAAG